MFIKIFSRTYEPKDFCALELPKYSFDYLTLDAAQLTVPKELTAAEGDFCSIGEYDGLIKAVDSSKKGITVLTMLPLLAILNITAYRDRNLLYTQAIENFFAEWIKDEFVYNADPVQNIEGLNVEVLSNTGGCKLNLVDDVNNIYEIAVKALLKYKMVISMKMFPQEKRMQCSIKVNDTAADYIKADEKNIIEAKINLQNAYGTCNKLTAVDGNGLERNMVYYADNYEAPCFPVTEIIKTGSKEEFKVGTKYKWVYLPLRPKIIPKDARTDVFFATANAEVAIDNTGTFGVYMAHIHVIIVGVKSFTYLYEDGDYYGNLLLGDTWYYKNYGETIYTPCPDGYPSTGLDDNGKPGILIDSELTDATRIDLLGDYVATKPIEFYERAIERTYELFKPAAFNNLIELTVKQDDGLVYGYEIGREMNIISKGSEIPSILTGYEIEGDKIKYIFGGVRVELTKKLKFERRK